MTGTRGGRKKRGAQEAHLTRCDQDCPNPPTLSRYPTRSSRVVVPPLFASPSGSRLGSSSITRPILRPAQRFLKEARVVAKPEELQLLHLCEMEDVKPSPSARFPSFSTPFSQHEMDLDGSSQPPTENDVVLHVEGIQEKSRTNDAPSSSQCLSPSRCLNMTEFARGLIDDSNDKPDEVECAPVLHVEGIQEKSRSNDVPPSSVCLSLSRSLNLTEFARELKDDSDSELDEVESAPGPAYDFVNGHKVKIEIAPLIRAMFGRYGDITSECSVKSPEIISFLLERLCDVYQKLEQMKLPDLTRGEIDKMLDELQFLEVQKLNISWLLEKLQHISETKIRFQKYLMAKDEEAKCTVSCDVIDRKLEIQRRHLFLIEKSISEAEKSKAESRARANEYKQMALDIKRHLPSVKAVKNQSLVHGLL